MHNTSALFWLALGGVVLYLIHQQAQDIPAYTGAGPYPEYGPPAPAAGPCPDGMSWTVENGQNVCR